MARKRDSKPGYEWTTNVDLQCDGDDDADEVERRIQAYDPLWEFALREAALRSMCCGQRRQCVHERARVVLVKLATDVSYNPSEAAIS